LGNISPRFVSGQSAKRFARKFKRTIHVVDSTTIQLIASCMDWAKHRRRQAAAKCHLRLADFLGTGANAVRWQIWTALLVYLLLRYLAFLSNWARSFSRLFALVGTCLWRKWDLLKLATRYGAAGGSFRYLERPEQAFFPGSSETVGQPTAPRQRNLYHG
jgi:hypothetical protein